jgi:hypothetical protein
MLLRQYYLSEAENWKVTLFPWVVILIRILGEALITLLYIIPEVTSGFY